MPQFEIEVGGNIAPITKSLTELKARLKELKFDIEKSTDAAAIAVLNKELRHTEDEIKRIRNIGPIIPPGATASIDKAGQAMTNVGRVAQDLPFGFIGIQNNLNPLLESFQRLRQETGSNVGALKAFGQSLLGPAGIGLALSVVSSAILIYQNGIAGFNKKTKEAKDTAEDFAKSLKTIGEVSGDATAKETGNIANVQALAKVIQSTNIAYSERKRALEELKEVNKSYFGDLTLESDSLKLLTDRVNEYSQALIAQAVLKGFTDEISRVAVELAKQDRALKSSADEVNRLRVALTTTKQSETSLTGEDRINRKYIALQGLLKDANKAFTDQLGVVNNLRANFDSLSGEIDGATRATLKLRNLTNPAQGKQEEDALKKRLAALERLKKVTEDADDLSTIQESIFEVQLKIAFRDQAKNGQSDKEINQLVTGFKRELQEAFDAQADSHEVIPKVKFSPTAFAEIPKIISDRVSKATGNEKITITLHNVRIRFLGEKQTKLIEDKEAINEQLTKEINDSFQNLRIDFASTIGEQLGEAFANAIEGGDIADGLKNAAKAMLGILGSTMQQIGRQVIAAAIKIKLLKEVLEKWAIANPGLAIIAGIGLVAAGAALKNFTFQGPKFAKGGIVTSPTIGMIGEAGKEAIIPLNKLGSMIGSNGGNTVVLKGSLGIRGRELVAFLEQEQTRFNRIR